MANYMIAEINEKDWPEVSGLIAQGVPNALISKLGIKAGVLYYKNFVKHANSCCYVAKDESGIVTGMIIGTVGFDDSNTISFKLRLIIAANIRMFRLSVINWFFKGLLAKIKGSKRQVSDCPAAELLAIAVKSQAKGTGLAQELVMKLEDFMVLKKVGGPYKIRTEKMNLRSNRFYEKIGAEFIKTDLHHGNEINEWHKLIE